MDMDILEQQRCPICSAEQATLVEDERDVAYFGKIFLFSLTCKACGYHQSDVEAAEVRDPVLCEFTITSPTDLQVRVVKSSEATVTVPQLKMSVEPGMGSNGYVSNIEGVLHRFKKVLEEQRETTDDEEARKTAKNLLKKLWKVECGDMELKIIIADPSGNSAIISDKAKISPLKVKK